MTTLNLEQQIKFIVRNSEKYDDMKELADKLEISKSWLYQIRQNPKKAKKELKSKIYQIYSTTKEYYFYTIAIIEVDYEGEELPQRIVLCRKCYTDMDIEYFRSTLLENPQYTLLYFNYFRRYPNPNLTEFDKNQYDEHMQLLDELDESGFVVNWIEAMQSFDKMATENKFMKV